MIQMTKFQIIPLSMVTKEGLQRVDIRYHASQPGHLQLSVYRENSAVAEQVPVALNSGAGTVSVLLPEPEESFPAIWVLTDRNGRELARTEVVWSKPRHRTMYVMLSSHTDIGLHESQYIQRYESVRTVDLVKQLCDETEERAEEDRYRYTMEGTWFGTTTVRTGAKKLPGKSWRSM